MLAGDAGLPGVAGGDGARQGAPGAGRVGGGAEVVEGAHDAVEVGHSAASTSRTAGALPARIWVHRPGSLAAIRVTSRRPWPARATAASSSPSSRAATRLAASCGTWETAATAASWCSGSSVLTAAPAERATAVTSAIDAGSVSWVGVSTQARPSKRSCRPDTAPERSRPAIGCDPQ